MGSRKITRTCPGYGSAQNFAGYLDGLVKSFFEDFNYKKSRNVKKTNYVLRPGPGPARAGPGLARAGLGPAWAQSGSQKHENGSDPDLMPTF